MSDPIDDLAAVRDPCAPAGPGEEALFADAMAAADAWHRSRNRGYDRLWDRVRPTLPVGLFKATALDTPVEEDGAWLGSSGTSGGARTQVYFDRRSMRRIELAMLQLFLHARFFDVAPARFLLLAPDPRRGSQAGYATAFDRFTGCAPVAERVYAVSADGRLDAAAAWAALARWAADEAGIFVFGLTVYFEQLVLAAPGPAPQRGQVKALTGGGWKGLAQRLSRPEVVERLAALLPAPLFDVRDLFGLTEHPLHYLSCPAGRFHMPRYSRAIIVGPDGGPTRPGEPGLIRLMNPFFASLPSHDLLTEDRGVVEDCACGGGLGLHYLGRVTAPSGTCAAAAHRDSAGDPAPERDRYRSGGDPSREGAGADPSPAVVARAPARTPRRGGSGDDRLLHRVAVPSICDEDLLVRKVDAELGGRRWRPVGRVLVVVAESDHLGAALAFLGACVTGNGVRVKARQTRALVESLSAALAASDCEILDWDGAGQDDAAVLDGIDAVLVAGGEEVIRHYRRVAPAHVRLIEFGPRLSAAAIGPDADPTDATAIDRLIADVTLFGQRVCSAPQLIAVDPIPAEALFEAVAARLGELPRLGDEERLAQHVRGLQLELLGRLDGRVRVQLDRATGWGVTLCSSLDPALRLHRGFPLVVGDVPTLLAELARENRRRLQTLGTWGLVAAPTGFSRVTAIGTMHARSPLEPHDGVLELAGLVDFPVMKVFVTGASGFIGRHLVRLLGARGHQVVALVRARERAPDRVASAVGDVTRPEGWRDALAGCDAAVHLAADYRLGPVDRRAMYATNVEGTRALIDAAIARGVGRILHVSSTAALGETGGRQADEDHRHNGVFRSYYEETKHIAHGLAESRIAAGAPVSIAAPGGVFGAGDASLLARTLADLARGKLPVQVATTSRFNLCPVEAVSDGLCRILEDGPPGESWILTGIDISMPELLSEVAALCGRKPPRAIPARALAAPARVLDLVSRVRGAALPLSREALALMDGSTYTYSSAKARRRLGWVPGDVRASLAAYTSTLR